MSLKVDHQSRVVFPPHHPKSVLFLNDFRCLYSSSCKASRLHLRVERRLMLTLALCFSLDSGHEYLRLEPHRSRRVCESLGLENDMDARKKSWFLADRTRSAGNLLVQSSIVLVLVRSAMDFFLINEIRLALASPSDVRRLKTHRSQFLLLKIQRAQQK